MATAAPHSHGPRLSAVLREEDRVTPLELFFDLVFVLAFTQCTALMADQPTWQGLAKGLLILGVLWWAWVGYAWLTSVVEPEEGVVRLAMFAAMAALLVVALCVPAAFSDSALLFACAYAIVRVAHAATRRAAPFGDRPRREHGPQRGPARRRLTRRCASPSCATACATSSRTTPRRVECRQARVARPARPLRLRGARPRRARWPVRLTTVARAAGLRLARDLPATRPGQIPLLRSGAIISERYQRALAEQGIHAVWVADELSEGIEPAELIPEPVRAETAGHVQRALDSARDAFASSQPLPPPTLQELSSVVERLAANVLDSPDAALALADLAAADQYTHRHSINVTALGLMLGRLQFRRDGWLDYRGERRFDRLDERLSLLGMGLLLHDVGKMAVPSEVLNKPGALDEAEWALMRGHPEAGVALLNPRSTSPLVTAVIRDHHERMDGSGYPRGITGEEIHQFARIAAVGDVYDAVTSQRPYKEASPPHVGVKVITEGDGTFFDPEVVATFRAVVFPFPVGTELSLADGRVGVVAHVDPGEPDVPIVRLPTPAGPVDVAVDTRTDQVAVQR